MSSFKKKGQKRYPVKNQPSRLLSNEENKFVFDLLGNRCQTLATTVVQVYLKEGRHWKKKMRGVACFVKDYENRSYYIRVYDSDQKMFGWEEKLNHQIIYRTPRTLFHVFETESLQTGLKFVDKQEANQFKLVILDKLNRRSHRNRVTRRMSKANEPSTTSTLLGNQESLPTGAKKKLSKADISEPTGFRHISHVRWESNTGFHVKKNYETDKPDPNLEELFKLVGINDRYLQDEATRSFIYDFIDKEGIHEKMKHMNSSEANSRDDVASSSIESTTVSPVPPKPLPRKNFHLGDPTQNNLPPRPQPRTNVPPPSPISISASGKSLSSKMTVLPSPPPRKTSLPVSKLESLDSVTVSDMDKSNDPKLMDKKINSDDGS